MLGGHQVGTGMSATTGYKDELNKGYTCMWFHFLCTEILPNYVIIGIRSKFRNGVASEEMDSDIYYNRIVYFRFIIVVCFSGCTWAIA